MIRGISHSSAQGKIHRAVENRNRTIPSCSVNSSSVFLLLFDGPMTPLTAKKERRIPKEMISFLFGSGGGWSEKKWPKSSHVSAERERECKKNKIKSG